MATLQLQQKMNLLDDLIEKTGNQQAIIAPDVVEAFLDTIQDDLQVSDLTSQHLHLWDTVVTHAPQFRERCLLALTTQDTTYRPENLLKLAETWSCWNDPDTILLLMQRAKSIGGDAYQDMHSFIFRRMISQYYLHLDEHAKRHLDHLFEQLIHQFDGFGWTGYDEGKPNPKQLHPLMKYAIHHGASMVSIFSSNLDHMGPFQERGAELMALLVAVGFNPNLPTHVTIEGNHYSCVNALHLAALLQDHHPNMGPTIETLITLGAEVDPVLAHRHAPKGAGLAAIQKHPKLRAKNLLEFSGQRHESGQEIRL